MVSGLPDRPLSFPEIEKLNQSDALGAVFPATPESIIDDADNRPRIYDLLITSGETISAVVYEEDDGWTIVGNTDADAPKEKAVEDVIEYRGYDIDEEEKTLEFVADLYDTMGELSD